MTVNEVTEHSTSRLRRLPRLSILAVGVVVLIAACGGGSKSTATAPAQASSTSVTTHGSASSTTASAANTLGGVELSKTPAAVGIDAATGDVAFFPHLSDAPHVAFTASGFDALLSPDRRHAVIQHRGDAVNTARLEIVSTDTGKAEHEFDLDGGDVMLGGWSPDSSAVVVGINAKPGKAGSSAVYRVDGTMQATTAPLGQPVSGAPVIPTSTGGAGRVVGPSWVVGKSGATVMACTECTAPGVLTSSKGKPIVVVGNTRTHVNGRYDPDSGQIVPFDGEFGHGVVDFSPCGRFAGMRLNSEKAAMYDSDTDRITPIPLELWHYACPIPSNDGDRVALSSPNGPVVIDLGTGRSTQVGREGSPIAWSSDDSKILLTNPTNTQWFVVAADGSGGKAASVRSEGYCVVGTTGIVLVRGATDFVAYDIGTDSSKTLANASSAALSEPCQVSEDQAWVLSGRTIVDLAGGHAASLPSGAYTVSWVSPSSISVRLS